MVTSDNNALPQSIGSRTDNKDIHSKGSTPSRQVEVSLGLCGIGSESTLDDISCKTRGPSLGTCLEGNLLSGYIVFSNVRLN